jgi:hypothetical protein
MQITVQIILTQVEAMLINNVSIIHEYYIICIACVIERASREEAAIPFTNEGGLIA